MLGFVKLHRKIIDNPIFVKPGLLQLFIYCILKANHKENEFIFSNELIRVKRGCFISGRKQISKDLKESENKIYNRLKALEKLNFIVIKSNNKYSIIEVINYDNYQNRNEYRIDTKMLKFNNKKTAERLINKDVSGSLPANINNKPTTNQQQTNTNKNDKNDKNEKKFLNCTVNLFKVITGKEYSYSYSIVNKLLKYKSNDIITYLQKCLMLMYVIKQNEKNITHSKYIGILTNQYRELSYTDFKASLNRQIFTSNNFEILN